MRTKENSITRLHSQPLLFKILLSLYLSLITDASAFNREGKEPVRFWAIPDLEQTIFNWTPHPEAILYRLEVDGVALEDSTTSLFHINLSPALENGSEIKLQAKTQEQWRAVEQLTLNPGQPYHHSFEIQEGRVVADYRLVSFPAGAYVWDGENKVTPLSYMRAYLGTEHHPSNWICGTWEPSTGEYIEASQLETFMPGRSYWMISNWDMSFEILGEAPQHDDVQVVLQPGWNMVSSPYPSSGGWGNLSVQDEQQLWTRLELLQSEDPPLWPSIWGWTAGHYQELLSYESGQGFWLLNRRQYDIGLLVSKQERLEDQMLSNSKAFNSSLEEVSPPAPPSSTPQQSSAIPMAGGGGCLLQARLQKSE